MEIREIASYFVHCFAPASAFGGRDPFSNVWKRTAGSLSSEAFGEGWIPPDFSNPWSRPLFLRSLRSFAAN